MEILTYEFKGAAVEFLLSGDLMINATEMGAVFNKRPIDFLERKASVEMINAMKKRAIGDKKGASFEPFLSQFKDLSSENVVKSVNGTPILITIPGREGSTWMHRWLAIDFAMYLDVEFKLWVLEKIDLLFVAFSQIQRELIKEETLLKQKRSKLIEANKDNPAAIEIATIDDRLKEITNEKGKATKNQYKMWNI